MAELESGIIAAIVLGSLLVILVLAFLVTSLFVVKRKRLLCFKKGDATRPFLLTDRELEKRHGGWQKQKSTPFEKKRRKKHSKNKKKTYHSLSRPPKFPKRDPFAGNLLENPLVTVDDLEADWSNPAFDMHGAVIHDAAITIQSWYRMIRVRVPYLQLKESVVLVQSLYRGRKARRMLPKYRKEKAARDQLRKKQPGWRKQGTLSGLKYYDVKAFGFAEVEQLYGMETVRNAAQQLKEHYGGKGKIRLKLFISVKGVKLYNYNTMEHFATVKVATVSFCTLDPKNRKIFAFINRKRRRNFCHVFQASESDAQKMVETMAQAFEVTFKQLEKKKESKEKRKLKAKLEAFQRQSQELDDEVQSMLDMAENASSTVRLDRMSEVSSEDGGSAMGSRENLLSRSPRLRSYSNHQSSPSGLLTSHTASERMHRARSEEVPGEEEGEGYSMATDAMNYTALTLDKEHRRTRKDQDQQRWTIDIPSD